MEARLEGLARATGRSKASCVRDALAEHLDDLEDAAVAERRLEDLRAGRSDTVSLEDIMARHGVAD